MDVSSGRVSDSAIDSLISALMRLKQCEAGLRTGEFWTDPVILYVFLFALR